MPIVGAVPVVVLPDTIAVSRLIAGRSLARLIVPVRPGEKPMVLATPAGPALEALIAARSDPAPLSLRFVTVKFAMVPLPTY